MNIKNISILGLILAIFFGLGLSFKPEKKDSQQPELESKQLAQSPPMGWNSFDSYGVYLHEEAALANLEVFAKKLKPHGYKYFVIDAGWFGEFKLKDGTMYPAEKHATEVNINEYGLLQPSKTYFPNGLQPIIDRCHELGLKFGIHLMRGIPRAAYKKNTPIKGTDYHARDIADTTSICEWNHQNYGVDMSKPGAQEFYNSLINQMADWGVDFLKYDDLVPFPKEVEGVANAIEQCGRPMVYSLSPGNKVDVSAINSFKRAHMLRVTPDIWDDQVGLDQCFDAWRKWQGEEEPGFWIDLDMIPFGKLQLMSPKPEGVNGHESKKDIAKKIESGELSNVELLAGKGWTRQSAFTKDQMYTFITLRALSASPLMMGGDLPTLDDFSLELITHEDVLDCNQNGIMGSLIYDEDNVEIWKTPKKDRKDGWIGIFNRSKSLKSLSFSKSDFNFVDDEEYIIHDIWANKEVDNFYFTINPNGVVFLKYASPIKM
ncbi:glycoside hydrolase family 27 protein [Aestuariivivens sediminis]|uniref:glycoside hydrolase family 27 protein n=1 Tax=Aestuariivivens sediminis TaxID=2913557 RepID=UPI001F57F0AF|nr:glycoside hydrolase family 27 protein [Aestuariivivens sediminis]